jgi:hypothetical protein
MGKLLRAQLLVELNDPAEPARSIFVESGCIGPVGLEDSRCVKISRGQAVGENPMVEARLVLEFEIGLQPQPAMLAENPVELVRVASNTPLKDKLGRLKFGV